MDYPFDFFLTADHRVKLIFLSKSGQIPAVTVKAGGVGSPAFSRLRLPLRGAAPQHLKDGLSDLFLVGPERVKNLSGDAFAFTDQPQKQVFGSYVVMPHPAGFIYRKFQNPFSPRRQRHLIGNGALNDLFNHLLHQRSYPVRLNSQRGQGTGGDTLTFPDQAQQEMFSADKRVIKPFSFFLSQI